MEVTKRPSTKAKPAPMMALLTKWTSLIAALELGVACLERASAARDIDFVRRQLQDQVRVVCAQMETIPAKLVEGVTERLGTKNGQLLAPVAALVGATEKTVKDNIAAVQKMYKHEIDPQRRDSTLAKALAAIGSLLDPKRDGSVQKVLQAAVRDVARDDGAIATVLKKVLDSKLTPLRDEIDRLAKEYRGQEAAQAALAKTIEKGETFELEILPTVQCWGRFVGASVSHVGGDRKPGDITVQVKDGQLSTDGFTIVIEARDQASDRVWNLGLAALRRQRTFHPARPWPWRSTASGKPTSISTSRVSRSTTRSYRVDVKDRKSTLSLS